MWTLTKEFKDYVVKNNLEQLGSMKIGLLTNPEVLTSEEKYTFVANKVENRYVATATVDSAVNFSRIVILYQENGQGEWTTLGYTDTFIEFEDDSNTKKIEFTFSLDDVQVKDVVYEELFTELKQKIEEATTKYNTEIEPLYKELDHSDNGGDGAKFLNNLIPYYAKLDKLMDEFRNYFINNKFSTKLKEINQENRKEIEEKLKNLDTLLTRGKKGYNVVASGIYSAFFHEGFIYTENDNIGYGPGGIEGVLKTAIINKILSKRQNNITEEKLKTVSGLPKIELPSENMHGDHYYVGSILYHIDVMNGKETDVRGRLKANSYKFDSNIDLIRFSLNLLSNEDITELHFELINPVDILTDLYAIENKTSEYELLSYLIFGNENLNPSILINYKEYMDVLNKRFYEKSSDEFTHTLYKGTSLFVGRGDKLIKLDKTNISEKNDYIKLLLALYDNREIDILDSKNRDIFVLTQHWIDNAGNHIDELISRFEAYKQDSQHIQERNEILEKIKAIADGTESNKTIIYKDYIKKAINKIFLNKDDDLVELGSKVETPYRFTYGFKAKDFGLESDPNYETVYKPIEDKMDKFESDISKYFFVDLDWDAIATETGKEASTINGISFKISEKDNYRYSMSGGYNSFSLVLNPFLTEETEYKFAGLWCKGLDRVGLFVSNYDSISTLKDTISLTGLAFYNSAGNIRYQDDKNIISISKSKY